MTTLARITSEDIERTNTMTAKAKQWAERKGYGSLKKARAETVAQVISVAQGARASCLTNAEIKELVQELLP